jgi:glucosamine--fructose-6-phosphate aminotransferase (isomerizing)
LVIGLSNQGNFIASDQMALLSITKQFIFLEEGDIADITLDSITIFDKNGTQVKRAIKTSKLTHGQTSKGDYAHYMQKEIFEQPQAIGDTLESRITKNQVLISAFGHNADKGVAIAIFAGDFNVSGYFGDVFKPIFSH